MADHFPWHLVPFPLLLLLIALGPLCFAQWWEKYYICVVGLLTAMVAIPHLLFKQDSSALAHALRTYFHFIALIGSLFVIAGGIHLEVKGESTPRLNVLFLACGSILSNIIGTTGASMLLIRPWIRMNKYRITSHHTVFFIFLVSNVGGALTPVGDPPLLLGFLEGVPFFWIGKNAWPAWLMTVGLLLAIFYWLDRRNFLRAPAEVRLELAEPADTWKAGGLVNLIFLGVVLGAVFLPPTVGSWVMGAAAAGSFLVTKKAVHAANRFNFRPLLEVAVLFFGIFLTMIPILGWLEEKKASWSGLTPAGLYWTSGFLSSFLDNTPTYYSFLSILIPHDALNSPYPAAAIPAHAPLSLLAISLGSVFFGANTYIGNGPNLLVKTIAEHEKVRVPGFFGYIFNFTLPFMLPVLVIVWALFFHR